MEIYTRSSNQITLNSPVSMDEDGPFVVDILQDGEVVQSIDTVVVNDDRSFTIDFPVSLTMGTGEYQVRWRYSYSENSVSKTYEETQDISVIQPLLSVDEVQAIVGTDVSVEECKTIERAVRHIIQAHTGQTFGYYIGKHTVSGGGERMIRLPQRLVSLTSINGDTYWTGEYYVHREPYYLFHRNPAWDGGIKADFDGDAGLSGGYLSDSPIFAPQTRRRFVFESNVNYTLDGVWGWSSVPEAIKEAARLLVNDYACGDNIYRDRFVQIATGPDWRLEFNDGAYRDTGNVRANQLLESYVVKYGWEIV